MPRRSDRDRLIVPYDIRQHADDMPVLDTVLGIVTVIAADDVSAVFEADYPVQHILTVVALVQRYVILVQRQVRLLYDQQIALLYQRVHAIPHVGVNELTLGSDDVLERALTHLSHRYP